MIYRTQWTAEGSLNRQLDKIHNSSLNTTHSARNHGFIFREHLNFFDPISAISKACYYHIRQLRPYLDSTTACTIASPFVFSDVSLWFFVCVWNIPEPLNGFAPNSHGRRVWSLALTSLKVKVKDQGHQGQKRHFSAFSAACVRFIFGKASLASSFILFYFLFQIWKYVFNIFKLKSRTWFEIDSSQ